VTNVVVPRTCPSLSGLPGNRGAARAAVSGFYFTGRPCRHGHFAVRNVNGKCYGCIRARLYQADRDTYLAARRRRYANAKERRSQVAREWRRANPERAKIHATQGTARRRALLAGAVGIYTAGDIARIFASQNNRCAACGAEARLTIDHVVPLSKGGSNWPENIQGLCGPCNSSKRDRLMADFAIRSRTHATN
jgi:5-methylcytosine-specific restriction endonuclease McrA